MQQLYDLRDQARTAFERLPQREQLWLVGGGAGTALLVLVLVGLGISSAIARQEHRVQVKTKQLVQILALQGEYLGRQQERQERLRTLASSHVRLVSLVEDAARQAGVEIGQLRPEEGEPSADGVSESRLDLRVSGLSVDRLQDFLNRIEGGLGVVIIRRLKLARPYKRDSADLELTVTTYRLRA